MMLSACSAYKAMQINYSDISQKRQIDANIETIIVQPSEVNKGGLVKSEKDTDFKDEDNRILHIKKGKGYVIWNSVLEDAIAKSGVFNPNSKNILALRVNALDIRYPTSGGNFPTDITALYELVDTANSKVVFSKTITSHAESPAFSYFAGTYRWKDSVQRTINENVKNFIEELLKSKSLS